MDYINIGSNGFAQVGDDFYYQKNKVEMSYLMKIFDEKFPVPKPLEMLCWFAVKAFPHDFGTYHEIVVWFDDNEITDDIDDDDDDSEPVFLTEKEYLEILDNVIPITKYQKSLRDIFYEWINELQAFDIETEEITNEIKAKYFDTLDTSKAEHLQIVQANLAS